MTARVLFLILSSFGQRTLNQELGVNLTIDNYVKQLSELAINAKLNGVVASASEVKSIRELCKEDFIIACPAVRPTWSIVDDQVRVVTPTDAIKAGVDYMIIGRPVVNAENRIDAINMIINEIECALKNEDMVTI